MTKAKKEENGHGTLLSEETAQGLFSMGLLKEDTPRNQVNSDKPSGGRWNQEGENSLTQKC